MKLIYITLIILTDQFLKLLITQKYEHFEKIGQVLKGKIIITNYPNYGASLNILNGEKWILIFFSLFILLSVIALFKLTNIKVYLITVGISIYIGGLISNLVDRCLFGYVIDYIGIYIFGQYFVFNIADISIFIGILLIFITLIRNPYIFFKK